MRRVWIYSGALFLLLACSASAQAERHVIKAADIAASGAAVEEFVPKGWKIEEPVKGDLNQDGVADVALKLIEASSANDAKDKDAPQERARALVVLWRKADGRLERAAVADRLLMCTTCGGAFYGLADAPAEVAIRNGVLIVKQSAGSREVTETTFRFRYDPAAARFRLIGYDTVTTDRLTGRATDESTNFLTGLKITKKIRVNPKIGREVPIATTRKRVAVKPAFLEDIDYEKM